MSATRSGATSGRSDDNLETIKKRFNTYLESVSLRASLRVACRLLTREGLPNADDARR